VIISRDAGRVEVLERRRLSITPAVMPGTNQPYHFAKNLNIPEAEEYLKSCLTASKQAALEALHGLVGELHDRHYRIVGSAILLASAHGLRPLATILASHALIHAAEGEFFREAFSKACEEMELPITGFREHDLDEDMQKVFGAEAVQIREQISALGRSLGPPWTSDQKMAALAALLVLADRQNSSRIHH